MRIKYRLTTSALFLVLACICFVNVSSKARPLFPGVGSYPSRADSDSPSGVSNSSASENTFVAYKWNVSEKYAPLLELTTDRLRPGFDHSLSYPMAQFNFAILKTLSFDQESKKYSLPAIAKATKAIYFIEFAPTAKANNYVSLGGSNIELNDKDSMKTVRTSDGTKYIFVRFPDDEFRCATIREAGGATLNLVYSANGLELHRIMESTGRTITFNYNDNGISSISQNWMANSQGFSKTWAVGDPVNAVKETSGRYAHTGSDRVRKSIPSNAVVRVYTEEMVASDKLLAHIFGGSNAVAAGNGFEPPGLAGSYPLYRGDIIGDDGQRRRGHLSYAMHLYGSPDGRSDMGLYVPAGFTSHGSEPSPTDAAVTFYYPRLGNLTDVTLAVFHVANFQITPEGDRIKIGNIGGPGGSCPTYKHSHVEFYKGNTSLPAAAARAALRIDPATVFTATSR
jgi:hypothetical protein